MPRVLALSFLSCLLACAGASGGGPSAGGLGAVELVGEVMSEVQARAMVASLLSERPSAFWTPERGQALALEASIEAHLLDVAPARSRLREGLRGFRVQYFGILRGDRELILASYSCDDLGLDPHEKTLTDRAGDDCSFTIVYDPATDRFAELSVRGDG